MWHSYIFRKCCKFWHHTPLSCQKRCSKIQKIWHQNEAPYGQQISSHMQSFCNCVVKCASQGSHEAEQTQGNEEHGIEWDQGLKHISAGYEGSENSSESWLGQWPILVISYIVTYINYILSYKLYTLNHKTNSPSSIGYLYCKHPQDLAGRELPWKTFEAALIYFEKS